MSDDVTESLVKALEEIRGCADRAKLQPLWKQAFNALKKLPVDQNRAANIVAGRNVEALAKLVADLRAAQAPPPEVAGAVPDAVHIATTTDPQHEETLKEAMKLFRRRFKFAKLDEESRLGRGHLTKGDYQAFSIEAPLEYPRSIWDELTRRGMLKKDGKGFYELGPNA